MYYAVGTLLTKCYFTGLAEAATLSCTLLTLTHIFRAAKKHDIFLHAVQMEVLYPLVLILIQHAGVAKWVPILMII